MSGETQGKLCGCRLPNLAFSGRDHTASLGQERRADPTLGGPDAAASICSGTGGDTEAQRCGPVPAHP